MNVGLCLMVCLVCELFFVGSNQASNSHTPVSVPHAEVLTLTF